MQEAQQQKPVIFSGIQPTGVPHLGNYIGAWRNWKLLEDDYRCLYCLVDLHSLTIRQDPAELRRSTMQAYALLLAVGLDPTKSLLFVQSHVPAHAELAWILSCYTYMGELSRMVQFKEKSAKHDENINAGLFTYPVLQAADILLYQAALVPVGADQKQHLELTRDVAERFNKVYGDVFVIPEHRIPKVGARIMSLSDPTSKMSKSDPEETYISLLDRPDVIRRKIKRAVTDSEGEIRYDEENKPGVSNLLSILAVLTGRSIEACVDSLAGQGYGALKEATAEAVITTLSPVQAQFDALIQDKERLMQLMDEGAQGAARLAARTLAKVYKKIGLLPRG
ncbi:MAG: tryptophan--tRNA ligase [Clostridia bacterium]|nr:tryptophan--tRNA ligase [Clostridia bacterium]